MKECKKLTTKKYTTRKSPPFSAASCCGKTFQGNDGEWYVAEKRGDGPCRWYKLKKNVSQPLEKSIINAIGLQDH